VVCSIPGLVETSPSRSILVVEDDADIRETLEEILGQQGYQTRACANGLEALEQLRIGPLPDVILLDLMMPVMTGWQFRIEQKRDPRWSSIPVVAMSADATEKAVAIDANVYLQKPFEYGTLVGCIERIFDANERHRRQATLVETERLASLGTLAAGVAHEINNPLTYVLANLELCARLLANVAPGPELAQLHHALAQGRDGCERIRRIVRDLRLFSHPSEESEHGVDVRQVLDSAVNMVAAEIRSRARLTKDYGPVPTINANSTRLGQIFLNLVLNAAQAIREGAPDRNEIRLVARAEEGVITVEVHDTGEGIPSEILGKIFDPFFTTKPVGVGTGLGLSISHRLVTAMGGELTVESEPGARTTFRVRLPVDSRDAFRGEKAHEPQERSPETGGTKSVTRRTG
jgi:signal transduction histidine kinase